MTAQASALSTEPIVVRVAYERALWRRAMTGWWQSVVPPAPFARRAIFWAVVWFVIGVFAVAVTVVGLPPTVVLWGLCGAGLMIGVFGYLQRTRMEQFWDEIGRHWDRAGDTEMTFGPDGIELVDTVSRRAHGWQAVDAIKAVQGGTVIRSGISMIVVADAALPMPPEVFRKTIAAWRQS